MSWFSDFAGRAESLLNNIDQQTGVVLRSSKSNNKNKSHEGNKYNPTNSPKRINNLIKSTPKLESHKVTSKLALVQSVKKIKSSKKSIPKYVENVNNEPKDGLRRRRNSYPDYVDSKHTDYVFEMQNLEVENAMLRNEINVLTKETSDLISRLEKAEDDLRNTQHKLDKSEQLNKLMKTTKEALDTKLEQLKHQLLSKTVNIDRHAEQIVERDGDRVTAKKNHIMERIKILEEEINNRDIKIGKLEKELRHAQIKTEEAESSLSKTVTDSRRLEKECETYKLRVKNTLHAKDNEIKLLREGSNFSEETKIMREQIDSLKEEKEELSATVSKLKEEQNEARLCIARVEEMRAAGERMAAALKEALREERGERNKAEARCESLTKDLRALEIHNAKTIEELRMTLHAKIQEVNNLKESSPHVSTINPSSLNVADYDVIRNDKIQCLTQSLIQKQAKIDGLLADNNILRIQMGKLESKYKAEMSQKTSYSVVTVQDGDARRTRMHSASPLSSISGKIGVMIRKSSVFRTFVICYVIGLHLWMMMVLLANTPQEYVSRRL